MQKKSWWGLGSIQMTPWTHEVTVPITVIILQWQDAHDLEYGVAWHELPMEVCIVYDNILLQCAIFPLFKETPLQWNKVIIMHYDTDSTSHIQIVHITIIIRNNNHNTAAMYC